MKVLSIGNSFSQDAHKWLHPLAQQHGIDVTAVNLYIGGCSLQMHAENLQRNEAAYALEINGNEAVETVSIADALTRDDWDVVTVQQVSQLSGIPDSYSPYLDTLTAFIRQTCPRATLWFHRTWAYESDSDHGGFAAYDCDQQRMFACITDTTNAMAARIGAPIIPVGDVIQQLRQTASAFDYANGGDSLCRDGFHLTLDYGRYAAAATWLRTLSGKPVTASAFNGFDLDRLTAIAETVNAVCNEDSLAF